MPAGGVLTLAYSGSALSTMARAKEQIMLTGGVMTSMAMSQTTFKSFVENRTGTNGIFAANEDVRVIASAPSFMHAVFCYGWRDNPRVAGDGYWICKNRLVWRRAHMQLNMAYNVQQSKQ
jgi:hypothetical protein